VHVDGQRSVGADASNESGVTHTRFESVGVCLPAATVSTGDLVSRLACGEAVPLQEYTGIRSRRVCRDDEGSLDLALGAAADCLSRSRYRPDDLDLIVSCSIARVRLGPPRVAFEPSLASVIKRALGARRAIHFDVANACAGMMTGVQLADRLIKAGRARNALIVSGERITPIAQTALTEIAHARDAQVASLTVGDAGAAVVVDASPGPHDRIHHIELVTSAAYAQLCFGKPSDRQPGMAMYADNRAMHTRDRVQLWPRFQGDVLAQRGASFADERYDHVVHHQVSVLAMDLFSRFGAAVFRAPVPDFFSIVEEHGNTATTSHFLALHAALRTGRFRPGDKVLFVPAASGIVVGFVSATMSSLSVA
jgi:3-oxoacyl-[acyl-carrier-protein] synthase-3